MSPKQQQSGYMHQLPTIKGQRQPLQQQPPQRQESPPVSQRSISPPRTQHGMSMAQAMYPWATKFQDADGQVKNRYNMPNGATLQPLVAIQGSQALDTIKRKEAFAATLRPGTSGYAFDR